jgi:hypothetical protein
LYMYFKHSSFITGLHDIYMWRSHTAVNTIVISIAVCFFCRFWYHRWLCLPVYMNLFSCWDRFQYIWCISDCLRKIHVVKKMLFAWISLHLWTAHKRSLGVIYESSCIIKTSRFIGWLVGWLVVAKRLWPNFNC